jgi:DNA repair protein RadC
MKSETIASESFTSSRKTYFLNFMRTSEAYNYLEITRSDRQEDHSFKKSTVVVFEPDFKYLFEALSSLFYHARHSPALKVVKPGKGIKSWPEKLRPREKLMSRGREAMEDAELLAMLIGSGTVDQSAVALCRNILRSVGYDLNRLAEIKLDELCRFKGIGVARGLSILAAMELSARMQRTPLRDLVNHAV